MRPVDSSDNVIYSAIEGQSWTIHKVGPDGDELWHVAGQHFAVDGADNVVVTTGDILVVEYGPDGEQLWARDLTADLADVSGAVAIPAADGAGHVFLLGGSGIPAEMSDTGSILVVRLAP